MSKENDDYFIATATGEALDRLALKQGYVRKDGAEPRMLVVSGGRSCGKTAAAAEVLAKLKEEAEPERTMVEIIFNKKYRKKVSLEIGNIPGLNERVDCQGKEYVVTATHFSISRGHVLYLTDREN